MTDSSSHPLAIDTASVIGQITEAIGHAVRTLLRKHGATVAVSGGIDSAVCAALCARALGPDRVLALALPDRHTSPDSTALAQELCRDLGIELLVEPIDATLDAAGCYRHQAEALKPVFPAFREGDRFKIVLPSLLAGERLALPRVTLRTADGTEQTQRLPASSYLHLVAATNFKQRTRTMMAYFNADRLNYAVCGTPNLLEFDQGFFVKGGDGQSDFTPIAHLYKQQVYALGKTLRLPESILRRTPTTDTFPLEQTQEEFYFSVPYETMDLCLYGVNHAWPADRVAALTGLSAEQVGRVYQDIEAKRRATLPLHLPPLRMGDVGPMHERAAALSSRRTR